MTEGRGRPLGGQGEGDDPPRSTRGAWRRKERAGSGLERWIHPWLVHQTGGGGAYRKPGSTMAEKAKVLIREQESDGHDRAAQGHVGTLPLAYSGAFPEDTQYPSLMLVQQAWSEGMEIGAEMPVTVRQVSVSSEPETAYFLRLAWNGRDLGSGFQAMLTDGQSAWNGEVGEDAVSKEAAELEMKKERYVQDLHQVLTGEGSLDPGFSFTLTPCHGPSSSRTLAYEKVESDIWEVMYAVRYRRNTLVTVRGSLQIQLGSVSLRAHPEPLDEVTALLTHFLQQTAALENHNQRLTEENRRFRQEQQHITAEMKRYVAEKVSLEGELYTRFVLVLNEKKAKIRSLQERIAALQENSTAEGKASSPAQRRTSGRPSEEEEDYGAITEEDPEEGPVAGPAPTTSTANTEVRSRSPLGDSPSDLTDIAPCRKRRFRHKQPPDVVAKKPTPEKTPTQRDSPVTSRRTANKQQAPQCSSDAMATSRDTEDLFEDF